MVQSDQSENKLSKENMAGWLSRWNSKVEVRAKFFEISLPLGLKTLASFQSRFSRLSNEWVRSRSRLWYSKSWRLRHTRRQWNILRAEVEGFPKVGFYKEICSFRDIQSRRSAILCDSKHPEALHVECKFGSLNADISLYGDSFLRNAIKNTSKTIRSC